MRFYAAVLIFESKALVSKLEAIICKVMDNNEKKKRMRERTPLFIGKKGRKFAFTYYTRLVSNEIAPVK